MSRNVQRHLMGLLLLGFGVALISAGHAGVASFGARPEIFGYFCITLWVLSLLGANIWKGGPLDPRADTRTPSPYASTTIHKNHPLYARISRNGDLNDLKTLRPLLTLEEFFEGNDITGSICCNLTPIVKPSEVYQLLKQIRARGEVANVRIAISVFDDPQWPFADTIVLVTSASADEVTSWFPENARPDDVWVGLRNDMPLEHIDVPPGLQVVSCWYD